jgi:hypothetical protein
MPQSPAPLSFSSSRKWRIGFNVLVSILALVAAVVMANYLAARHFRRFQWASDAPFRLSPATTDLLRSITNHVKVVVFFDRTRPLYDLVSDLLEQYRLQSPNLELEYVDYVRSLGRAKAVQTEYGLGPASEGDRIIFDGGSRRRVVYARDLSDYDYAALLQGKKEVKRTAFKGEQAFTSALYSLLDARPIKAYFLTGHGEHDPGATDDQLGYSKFAKILQESQIAVVPLSPTALLSSDVPADCQLLVAANPLHPLAREELAKIEKYLNQGGRLLALLGVTSVNETTGLEGLLDNWGVTVGRNFVYDLAQGKAGDESTLIVTHFGSHAIVNPLGGARLLLVQPRSIEAKKNGPQGADAPKVAELVATSQEGVASRGAGRTERQGVTIPLMVAVERGAIQGITADRGATRIVVVGESQFLANNAIDYEANRDFARNAVNWLLNRDVLVQGIGSRPIKEYQITMTTAELATVRWLMLAGFPGGVLFLGFLVWLRRRT